MNNCMNDCINLTPQQISILASIIAIALSKDKTVLQLNILGNIIVAVGSLLLTIAAQQDCLESLSDNETTVK